MGKFHWTKKESGGGIVALIFLCIIVGAVCAVWFKFVQPFFIQQKIGLADHKFEFNKFTEADDLYKQLLTKAKAGRKRMIEDRIAQIPLAQKNLVEPLPVNKTYRLIVVEGVRAKIGLLYIHFRVSNFGKKPIPIRRSLFYLKSFVGKCEVALDRPQNDEVGVWEGDLLPGEAVEGGICVKYMLSGDDNIYLAYNNGAKYVNTKIPLSSIWPQTDKEEFEKPGWKGQKLKSIPKEDQKPSPPAEKVSKTAPAKKAKKKAPKAPGKAVVKKKPVQRPGYYKDPRYGFQIKVPNGWKKLNTSTVSSDSYARIMPFAAAFKGPEWKGRFPLLMIQKISNPYGASLNIDAQMLREMEKDIKRMFNRGSINMRKLSSRTTLIGNTKAAEVDLEFTYTNQRFHMKGFVLEGRSGYLLSFLAEEKDFNASSNSAIQAIRTFRVK